MRQSEFCQDKHLQVEIICQGSRGQNANTFRLACFTTTRIAGASIFLYVHSKVGSFEFSVCHLRNKNLRGTVATLCYFAGRLQNPSVVQFNARRGCLLTCHF